MYIYVSYGILQIYTQSSYDTKRETPDEYKKEKKKRETQADQLLIIYYREYLWLNIIIYLHNIVLVLRL